MLAGRAEGLASSVGSPILRCRFLDVDESVEALVELPVEY
jgi:hypothetical protein